MGRRTLVWAGLGTWLAIVSARPAAGGEPPPESFGYETPDQAYPEAETAPPRLFEHVPIPADISQPGEDDLPADDPSIQGLEKKIDSLRGQIQDTKSMLLDLGEDISKGFVTSTKLLILHKNALGPAFSIENIEYKLDGFTVYANDDAKKLSAGADLVVFDASVLPGNHTLDVVYTLRGTGYGVFTYMEEYKFDLRNQYYFAAPKGRAVELTVEALDRGVGETLRDRPTLKFVVR